MTDDNKPEIWQLQSQFNIEGLVKALSAEDKNIRKRAAAALRAMGANEAIAALRTAFAAEEDTNTRMIIATAIETLSREANKASSQPGASKEDAPQMGQSMVNRLIKRLKSDKPEDVIKAAQHLGDLGDKIAVEPLVLLFNDNNKSIQVRLAVAEALLKLESAPVEVALLANLRHTEWQIRRNGAAILGQLKADWAVQPLARALQDPHAVVRRTARAALKHISTPESRKALAQADSDAPRRRPPTKSTTASGITVKTIGQNQKATSGMLSKHLDQGEEEPKEQKGTKRLDNVKLEPGVDKSKLHTNVTMPLNPDILDQLEALEQQQKKDDEEKNE